MSDFIDARGLSCPQPVILVKKALIDTPEGCRVLTDSSPSKENITRFAQNAGYAVDAQQTQQGFELTIKK